MTQESHEMKTNCTGPLCGADPQTQLKLSLLNDDYTMFERIVNSGDVDLEHYYEYPDSSTCLEMAVSEKNKQEFIKLLIKHNVNVNRINRTFKAAPIHIAVENGNSDAVKILLEYGSIDVNIKYNGQTPLYMAIKKMQNAKDEDKKVYENIVEMLLKFGCNVNVPDNNGITPLLLAAKERMENVLKLILKYAKDKIDLDTCKDISHKNARNYLQSNFPQLLEQFNSQEMIESAKSSILNLFYYLSKHDEDNFIRNITNRNDYPEIIDANDGSSTMLQIAAEQRLENVVRTLLSHGADPNATGPSNIYRSVEIACRNGYSKILQMLVDKESTSFEAINGESLLHYVVKGMHTYNDNPKSDYKMCLKILLKHAEKDVDVLNYPDIKNNTPLHYAARNGNNETVLELLRNGACVGLRNKFNVPPLADINAKTLGTYLDECITSNRERPSDDNYEIQVNYGFLVYPNNSLENEMCKKPLTENSNINHTKGYNSILTPETDALLFMTRSEELKHLLKHPVITSFLYLKWQGISSLFCANLTFYSLFWLCLILYILLGYGVERKQSESIEVLNMVTYIGTIIGFILLIIRELLQLLITPKQYIQSVENWIEIALIFVTGAIVCYNSAEESTKQQLSSVAILLSSAEFVLLIGQFPILSTNIVMLRTVSWNFFKFLLWYCILIIAFALSFYTLFRKVVEDDNQELANQNTTANNEEDFFKDPGRSLFKTIVMLTGEFDAGSINFSSYPVTSHIIFIVFVFMIPIVLFNLLNGLAVNDTQEIRADAELVEIVSRVKLIAYFEGISIRNFRACSKLLCCCSSNNNQITTPKMFYANRICPFSNITIKPNRNNKIEIPDDASMSTKKRIVGYDAETGGCFAGGFQGYSLDGKIVKNAKIVLNKKTELEQTKKESEEKQKDLGEMKKELEEKKELDEMKKELEEMKKELEEKKKKKKTKEDYEKKLADLDNTIKEAKTILESVGHLESTFKNYLQILEVKH